MAALCECGCGGSAPIAVKTSARFGHVQGQPCRFIRGHAGKGKPLSPERREKFRQASIAQVRTPERYKRIGDKMRGSLSSTWIGGVIMREGRRLVLVGRDHPMADGKGYAYQHRIIVADRLGRPLTPEEHVHHLDLDALNNDGANLVLVSPGQHRRIHNRIRAGVDPLEAFIEVLASHPSPIPARDPHAVAVASKQG